MPTTSHHADLFGAMPQTALPAGLLYRPDFLSRDEEAALLATIAQLPLQAGRYKAYTPRRRVASFGPQFEYDGAPGAPLPETLLALRAQAADWLASTPARSNTCWSPSTPPARRSAGTATSRSSNSSSASRSAARPACGFAAIRRAIRASPTC